MDSRLAQLLQTLEQTRSPVALFGPLAGDPQAALRQRYHELVGIAHPDRHPTDAKAAHQAFITLQHWYELAQRQIAQGRYGKTLTLEVTVRGAVYQSYQEPLRGDLSALFVVDHPDGPLLLKVARQSSDNDLLETEARVLAQLDRELQGKPLRAHFPSLHERFFLNDGGGVRRWVNVLRHEAGMLSLSEVCQRLPGGLHPADAAWIFNRMLAALASAHQLGLIHGAVTLDHVLIDPADHNAVLIDWCYSVAIGKPLLAISPPHRADYPPEVYARQPVTPATDLYMAARCMLRLLGGTEHVYSLPDRVPASMRALLRACLIPSPHRRPQDAWQLFDDFRELLRELYGPPVFRPFPLSVEA